MLLSTPAVDTTKRAPKWNLLDVVSGQNVYLQEQENPNGFVVAFICNHCPYVIAEIDKFVAVAKDLQQEGIRVYGIMSNNYELYEADNPENMKHFASEHGFTFPYLVDQDQSVAQSYGAVCTPDIFCFNAGGYMQYRGKIVNLKDAMLQIKETGEGPEKQLPSQGCSIKWK